MLYQLYKDDFVDGKRNSVRRINANGQIWSIPFAPDNTDYANFKRDINEGEAQLQDADGNVMSAEAAQDFIKTLP